MILRQLGAVSPNSRLACAAVCLGSLFLVLASPVQAQLDNESEIYGPGVIDVLNSVIAARSDIKSWVLRASCSEKHLRSDDRAESLLYAAVDEKNELYRFETNGFSWIGISSAGSASSDAIKDSRQARAAEVALQKTVSLLVQDRSSMIEWYGFGESYGGPGKSATCHIELRDRGTPPSYTGSLAFNPQVAGLLDVTSENSFESVEEILKRFAANASSVVLVGEHDSDLKVQYDYPSLTRRILHIDCENGMTVSRSVFVVLNESRLEKDAPRIEASAKWEFKDQVWVPVSQAWYRSNADGAVAERKYAITWEAINPPAIDAAVFDYRTFKDFWPGLNVVERRDGKLFVLESANLQHYDVGRGGVEHAAKPGIERNGTANIWVILGNLGIVVSVAIFLIIKSRRK